MGPSRPNSALVSVRIRIPSGSSILSQCRSGSSSGSGFRMLITKNCKILQVDKILYLYFKNCNFLSRGLHEGVQATGKAFSPQKRTSSTFLFVGHFCPPGSAFPLRIRIQLTKSNVSCPQQRCFQLSILASRIYPWQLGNIKDGSVFCL